MPKKVILILVLLLGLVSLAAIMWQRKSSSSETPSEAVLVGNDRDAHGCISSAGYSWCESKNKCLRIFEENCESQPLSVSPTQEKENLALEIKALLTAKHGPTFESMKVTVTQIEGDYAQGGASGEGGGGMWFAVKRNGLWQLIWDGNGVILCSDIQDYPDLPVDFVPECYDSVRQMSVTR